MLRDFQRRRKEAQEERAKAARAREEERRAQEREELRSAWVASTEAGVLLRDAIRRGDPDEDLARHWKSSVAALHRWDSARSSVPEGEARAIYAEVEPSDDDPIPTDPEGLQALALEAFALLDHAKRFEVQARTAILWSENEVPGGMPANPPSAEASAVLPSETELRRQFIETPEGRAGLADLADVPEEEVFRQLAIESEQMRATDPAMHAHLLSMMEPADRASLEEAILALGDLLPYLNDDWSVLDGLALETHGIAGHLMINFEVGLKNVDDEEAWSKATFASTGVYAIKVTSLPDQTDDPNLCRLPTVALAYFGRQTWGSAEEFAKRIEYVGPQRLVSGISLDAAILAKTQLENFGFGVKIDETAVAAASGSNRRQAIPQAVRHEVWRRDQGRCVDCGSRERLEFDHIIPLSRGGSSTARNLELRCETCNRQKATRI